MQLVEEKRPWLVILVVAGFQVSPPSVLTCRIGIKVVLLVPTAVQTASLPEPVQLVELNCPLPLTPALTCPQDQLLPLLLVPR